MIKIIWLILLVITTIRIIIIIMIMIMIILMIMIIMIVMIITRIIVTKKEITAGGTCPPHCSMRAFSAGRFGLWSCGEKGQRRAAGKMI